MYGGLSRCFGRLARNEVGMLQVPYGERHYRICIGTRHSVLAVSLWFMETGVCWSKAHSRRMRYTDYGQKLSAEGVELSRKRGSKARGPQILCSRTIKFHTSLSSYKSRMEATIHNVVLNPPAQYVVVQSNYVSHHPMVVLVC